MAPLADSDDCDPASSADRQNESSSVQPPASNPDTPWADVPWTAVAQLVDCPVGHSLEVVTGGRVLAIFNVAGELFALDGVCPHQGGPLGRGTLMGTIVTCPWHGWQFDVRSGCNLLSSAIRQTQYPVRVQGEQIEVQFSS